MGSYFVYIMTNKARTVLYVGMTNDLLRRFAQHQSGEIVGFSQKYKTKYLVYYQAFNAPLEAIQAEKKIKGWTRQKKNNLIELSNPYWLDLNPHHLDSSLCSE